MIATLHSVTPVSGLLVIWSPTRDNGRPEIALGHSSTCNKEAAIRWRLNFAYQKKYKKKKL